MSTGVKAVVLGLKPFILIEFGLDDEDSEALKVDISSGGGVESQDVPEMLRDLGIELGAPNE